MGLLCVFYPGGGTSADTQRVAAPVFLRKKYVLRDFHCSLRAHYLIKTQCALKILAACISEWQRQGRGDLNFRKCVMVRAALTE